MKLSTKNLYIYLSFRWAEIDIPETAGTYYHFKTVHQRLSNLLKPDDKHIYRRYKNCRINFQTRIDQWLKMFSLKSDSNVNQPKAVLEDETSSALSTSARTSSCCNVMESSFNFVCNTRQENKDAHYNDGRKERCSLDSSKTKLISYYNKFIYILLQ